MLNIKDNGNSAWKPQDSVCSISPGGREKGDRYSPTGASNSPQQRPVSDTIELETAPSSRPSQPSVVPRDLLCTENGKLELSLIHFKLTNPAWRPADMTQQTFIDFVTSNALREESEERDSTNVTSTSGTPLPPQFQIPQSNSMSFGGSSLMMPDASAIVSTLSRDRSRVINQETVGFAHVAPTTSGAATSNLAMTLSTLFLHEYAATQSSGAGLPPQQEQPGGLYFDPNLSKNLVDQHPRV